MLIASYRHLSMAGWAWPNFRPVELACKCRWHGCRGEYWQEPVFLDALEALREKVGRAIRNNSGHRCGVRNVLVGGAAKSRHRRIAVDISLSGHDRHAVLEAAIACGFTGIGGTPAGQRAGAGALDASSRGPGPSDESAGI
ncbi:D-Ala-D-Ala carboxypeptidase family metallohydrolase [Hyphomonas sp.]|uniref:D-Ala-D-Ala carboxypeptidase family metallohydrolase n=1 Tax=Hyphomonas sp. TaxID=87 RepID=UPI0025BC9718|nr:D-Ala-D-Ala carboxypeptidase family metallohydrolase [Hyphomonas sp.]MBI1399258.1 hypothetical protein [Hyphomonas sp.]